jgi:hypothetical protein
MANLNGENIGANYKGFINIGSTINQNVSASLQPLTDGDGNNLPIQVSTAQIVIGGGSSLGRLVVRGDGTNPIVRFEGSAGTAAYVINAAGNIHTFTGQVNISDTVIVNATQGYFWNSRGGFTSSADGVIRLQNNVGSDFNRLQFGGTTNLFPSLKRTTTRLQARLADDTNFTNIQGRLTTETNFTAGPITPTGFLVIYDATGTAYKIPAVL